MPPEEDGQLPGKDALPSQEFKCMTRAGLLSQVRLQRHLIYVQLFILL